ncbi:MAG: class I SAM-dependent RNA methyltransferase [Parahaliea sp.]
MSLTPGVVFCATVRDLTSSGHAVLEHASGQVVFVPGVWLGEVVTVRVIEVKSRFARAELLKIDSPSPERRTAFCKLHGHGRVQCGGCPWQFVSYSAQCAAKQHRLENELGRLGISPDQILPLLPSPNELAYRNRAQLRSDGQRLGFLSAGGRELVDVPQCPILHPAAAAELAELRTCLPRRQWRPRRRGRWVTIDIDAKLGRSEGRRLPFRQANDEQNQCMQQWLKQRLDTLPREIQVLELFAGSGNFTQVLSQAGFTRIIAVEAVEEATHALAAMALPGVHVLTHNLYLSDAYSQLLRKYPDTQVLVMDPPRDGLQMARALFDTRNRLSDVLYISCDLATFCRDSRVILDSGFDVLNIQPLDLFPQTPHVELLAHFQRRTD